MARLLQINACDRKTGIPSNCTFKLDQPIGGRYRLAMVQVPYMQPPEATSRNDFFQGRASSIKNLLSPGAPRTVLFEIKIRQE